jgi:small neutral amino acid transporter SnatA (MarC family)
MEKGNFKRFCKKHWKVLLRCFGMILAIIGATYFIHTINNAINMMQ